MFKCSSTHEQTMEWRQDEKIQDDGVGNWGGGVKGERLWHEISPHTLKSSAHVQKIPFIEDNLDKLP